MNTTCLKPLEFELAYLSMLTLEGLKPLSRWEKPFDAATEGHLQELGLKTRVVERSVQNGRRVRELLLSSSDECLALYASRFDHAPIGRSRDDLRIEGLLFGFPSCCVESYATRGYARNSLRRRDQRILFHWACPQCAVTPLLLPPYHRIYRACRAARRGRGERWTPLLREPALTAQLQRAMAMAASLVALGTVSVPAQTGTVPDVLDPHVIALSVEEDPDRDFLATAEETILGTNPEVYDEDGNTVADGIDLARRLSAAIDALPTEPSATHPYVTHVAMKGVETCEICKEVVNMGYMVITNPLENQEITVPYMAKHFLDHGGFTYNGSLNAGRLNPALLKMVLTSEGLGHFLPLAEPATDPDNDGLRSHEEPAFAVDPAVRDTDGDQLIDGVDAARDLRAQLEGLPRFLRPEDGPTDRVFVVEHPMDGFEICPRCGARVVMDIWEVINPVTGNSISIPSMALHHLQHGAFGWKGGQLHEGAGRVDPLHLKAVLSGQGNGHWLPVTPDQDGDLLTDSEEDLLGSNLAAPDEDHNGTPDGADLARALSKAIDALPAEPSATGPYVTHHLTFGLETCQVCSAQINMGFLTVRHPLENQAIDIPYVGKHFLEHGSFAYAGSLHSGRVNPVLLRLLLTAGGRGHFVAEPPGTDADNDGLRHWEEPAFGTDPAAPDTDGDHLVDGIDAARALRQRLDALPRVPSPDSPYVVEHPMDGIEICPRCGERVVMDVWDVINPVTHDVISIPSMALHSMQHGGFGWEGGQLLGGQGRVDPRHLRAVLDGRPNRHLLPVAPDADGDLLTDGEEHDLGRDPANPDEDRNAVRDGIDLARAAACEIAGLPIQPGKDYVYRVDVPLRGLEQCAICGTNVNMGHLVVCNPMAQLYAEVPYITLHYLEHDSFSFAGDVHGTNRADVPWLLAALHSTGPSHLLPVAGDADADGLTDPEERHFHTDPANPDSNQDGMPDGYALARSMWSEVEALPRPVPPPDPAAPGPCYAVDHPLRGVVSCPVCGATINMGWVEIVNPGERLRMEIPYLALHFMRHGGFAWSEQDRVNPCLLDVLLHGNGTAHLVTLPGDSDGDGLLDSEEPHFGVLPDNPDTNGDGVPDGVALARRMHARIAKLPTSPTAAPICVTHYSANCVTPCPVCGEMINCGHMEITNVWAELSVTLSYMNAHYLEHGSFAASLTERVDPVRLEAILQPAVCIACGEGGTTLRWLGKAGRTYQVYTAPALTGPWAEGPVFHGDGTELVFQEERNGDVPGRFYKVVVW
ncbi:MAG: hypothetical protein JXQ71_14435 [Verrucomicrobia bacterium]|nr:hypothetical protein [Verrucomicrobiota bacterium]